MKKYYLIFTLFFLPLFIKAQTHSVNIFCTIDPIGRIDYYSLSKILPDSLSSKILINPHKEFDIKDNYKVLLYMTQNGWKLVNAMNQPPTTNLYYNLSRDIILDDNAYETFIRKLKTK